MKRDFSLRGRLISSMLLVFGFGLAASATLYYLEARADRQDLRERTLEEQASDLLAGLRFGENGQAKFALPDDWADVYASAGSGFYFTLFDASQRPVAASPNLAVPLPFFELSSGAARNRLELAGIDAGRLAVGAAAGPSGHVLIVGRGPPPPDTLAQSLVDGDYTEPAIIGLFVIASLSVIHFISGWTLRPLARASREAAAIGPANTSARIAAEGLPSEVRPLVEAANAALERLARAYVAERRLTADAAHELRTPLAVLSLRLQKAKLGAALDWPTVEGDLARLSRLVGQLMDLARKENPARADGTAAGGRLNLARVVREAAALVLPLAEEAGRQVEVDAPDVVSIKGRADDLRDMVVNLLDNALVHGQGAVHVNLRLGTNPDRDTVFIKVSDQGPGVPSALREELFDRFRKGQAASAGAGLGLAIVRQVARSHGGDARFLPGPGCSVEVTLPVVPEPERLFPSGARKQQGATEEGLFPVPRSG
jgi:two-component system sensor histidine kinase TctE